MSDAFDDEIKDINDPSLPEAVREHGRQFKNPAKYVEDLGEGEYALYTQDGELLDLIYLTS